MLRYLGSITALPRSPPAHPSRVSFPKYVASSVVVELHSNPARDLSPASAEGREKVVELLSGRMVDDFLFPSVSEA
jgi:hypothetical protein